MNATIRAGLIFLLGATVAAGAGAEVRVAASRGLRLAVVDASKRTEARETMHRAFAASLGASLTQQCGGQVGVRATCVGVDQAAFNLGTGVYDAVLVVGRAVPESLRRVDAITLSAIPESGKRDRVLYLVIANGDASLQGYLAAAFTKAVGDEKFLESFLVQTKVPLPSGQSVATSR